MVVIIIIIIIIIIIPFHSIQVNPSISQKSLMVARPYPSTQTCKGAHRIIYYLELGNNHYQSNTLYKPDFIKLGGYVHQHIEYTLFILCLLLNITP